MTQVQATDPRKDQRLQDLIEAAVLSNPDLKDKLTIGAAIMLMRLPDSTLGWVDSTEMSKDIKILSVITHLRIGAIPGMKHLLWLKNGFYPTAAYWTYRVRKDIEGGILKRVGSLSFTPVEDWEKEVHDLTPADRAIAVEEMYEISGQTIRWRGIGIIDAKDLAYRDKNNNPRAGMKNKKDIRRTLETRAMMDMYSRNWPVDGCTVMAEDILSSEEPEASVSEPTPSRIDHELDKLKDERLKAILQELCHQIQSMGYEPGEVIPNDADVSVAIAIAQSWIKENTPPPEPPNKPQLINVSTGEKPKRTRRTKEQMLADQAKPMVPPVASDQGIDQAEPLNHILHEGITYDQVEPLKHIASNMDERQTVMIDDVYTPDEIDSIVNSEPDFDDFDAPDPDPIYTGTEEQKNMIRQAVKDAGIAGAGSILHAIAGGMRGQPMSKLPEKTRAFAENLKTADKLPEPPTLEEKTKHRALCDKVAKIGGKIQEIVGVEFWRDMDILDRAKVIECNARIEAWYKKVLMGTQKI